MNNIKKFNVTCKNCGSNNIKLSAEAVYCGEDIGIAYLTCLDCREEEESDE